MHGKFSLIALLIGIFVAFEDVANAFEIEDLKNNLPVPITVIDLNDDFDEKEVKEVEAHATSNIKYTFPIKIAIPKYNEDFLFNREDNDLMLIVNCKTVGEIVLPNGMGKLPDLMCKEFKYKDYRPMEFFGHYLISLWNDEKNGGQLWLRADHTETHTSFAFQLTGLTRQHP